jgi:hypothetical protein
MQLSKKKKKIKLKKIRAGNPHLACKPIFFVRQSNRFLLLDRLLHFLSPNLIRVAVAVGALVLTVQAQCRQNNTQLPVVLNISE